MPRGCASSFGADARLLVAARLFLAVVQPQEANLVWLAHVG
jgi:hypothetical protein